MGSTDVADKDAIVRSYAEALFRVADAEGELDAVELAGRVVGASLDATAHQRLIDEYIDQVSKGVEANGKH